MPELPGLEGHKKVNKKMRELLPKWWERYSRKIRVVEGHSSYIVRNEPGVTVIETKAEKFRRMVERFKDMSHFRVVKGKDIEGAYDFIDHLKKRLGINRIPDKMEVIIVDKEIPDDVKHIFGKILHGIPLSEEEKERYEEYMHKKTFWPAYGIDKIEFELGEHIPKDIISKEKAAQMFLEGNKLADIKPFHEYLEELLKEEEIGKEDLPHYYDAWAHILKGLVLYRYRRALSSEDFLEILALIRSKLGEHLDTILERMKGRVKEPKVSWEYPEDFKEAANVIENAIYYTVDKEWKPRYKHKK